jgi:hypothetical protein
MADRYETWCYKKASNVGKIGEKAKVTKDRTLVARMRSIDGAVQEGLRNTSSEIPRNPDNAAKPRAAAPRAAYGAFYVVVDTKNGKIVATSSQSADAPSADDDDEVPDLGGGLDDDDED